MINLCSNSLTKFSLTLTKLEIFCCYAYLPLSFLNTFKCVKEMVLSYYTNLFVDFDKLQDVTFSQLQVLKFKYAFPEVERFTKFLEINGNNLILIY